MKTWTVIVLAAVVLAVAPSCHTRAGETEDASPGPPAKATSGIRFQTSETSRLCVLPIAEACNGPCPNLQTFDETFLSEKTGLRRCNPDAGGSPVSRGTCGPYRYVSAGTGYVSVVDWFDASGALIGEERGSDYHQFCSAENALFGTVPACRGEEEKVEAYFCAAPTYDYRGVIHPAWRSNNPQTESGGQGP